MSGKTIGESWDELFTEYEQLKKDFYDAFGATWLTRKILALLQWIFDL